MESIGCLCGRLKTEEDIEKGQMGCFLSFGVAQRLQRVVASGKVTSVSLLSHPRVTPPSLPPPYTHIPQT